MAQKQLPDAIKLIISYATEGGASRGTLKTVLKDINKPGIRIRNGSKEIAMPAERELFKTVGAQKYRIVTNPWRADLTTALISTQIPDIETYSAFPGFIINFMKGKSLWLRDFMLKRLVGIMPLGPSPKQLKSGKTIVWATVGNAAGIEKIRSGHYKPGFQTPSLYGTELIQSIPGVHITHE